MRPLLSLLLLLLLSWAAVSDSKVDYAIAIHGGAGWSPEQLEADKVKRVEEGLKQALEAGRRVLADGGPSLAAVERAVVVLEDHPDFNAGRGAVLNDQGGFELDASIMDGSNLRCGAVAGVRTVKNPVRLARQVMTQTRHVLLMGEGADQFAAAQKAETVPQDYFSTPDRVEAWNRKKARPGGRPHHPGTVGCVALDRDGRLAAATSTGGLTLKRFGRVGDSPVIGAGTYADPTCAVSCTGIGEEFIRRAVAYDVSARMRYGKVDLDTAVTTIVDQRLEPDMGGLIAVDSRGNIVMKFNTPGMARGAADSRGRFEVRIHP